MSPKDLLIASVVIVAWGVNFVVIKLGLHGVPPMLLGALRFALAAVPVVFVKRPQIPLRWLFAYSLTISLGQFALLFYGDVCRDAGWARVFGAAGPGVLYASVCSCVFA